MANVYLTLKRSVVFVLLLLGQAAIAQPVINFFHPAAGPAGTVVRISGTGFNTNKDSNFVYFGAAKATVLQYINDSLIVVVPKGATYAPITVTSNRLTGYSRLPFNVTYSTGDPVLDTTSFAPAVTITGTNNPRAVTLADLNSDGLLDLFVTSQGDSSAAVYKNTSVSGSVSYSAVQYIPLGSGPFGAAIGDLNGDGKLDVAVANFNSGSAGTVSVLRNTTVVGNSISFAKTTYATGNGSSSVAIADVDKDGKPDLLVTSGNSGYISVFRNTSATTSAITFAPAVTISDYFHSDNITVADFDGDGKVDFATANFAAGISIWKNASTPGSISFPTRIDYTAGTNPASIATGDLNRDGKPDLVVRNYSSSTLSVFKNTSSSGVISFAQKSDFAIGSNSGGLSIGDLNGDGKPDVAVSSGISGVVSLYTNTSGVDSIKLSAPANFATGYGPTGIAIGDVNNDGRYDFAVGNNYSQVTIFKNNQFVDTVCPVITSFFPTSGKKGTAVYILGSHFTGATAVRFGGVLADSVVIMSDTMIRAKVNTGATGSVQVILPTCSASKPGFTFIKDTICPVITSFWPTNGTQGTAVYILGSNFTGSSGVRFGGVPADSIVIMNDTMIKAIVDTGATGSVQVLSPYCSASKPGFTFIRDTTHTDTTVFAIYNFTPKSGKTGTVVTIFGSGFNKAWDVRFGGVSADSIVILSDTIIQAVVGNGATGAVMVAATNGYRSLPGFTYIVDSACPVITSFWPTSGTRGTAVYILGSNFIGSTGVRFGGVPADSIIIVNDTLIKAIVDTGATGSVQVLSPYCSASKPGFTYIADTTNIPDTTAPVISGFWPTSGTHGTTIYIWGSRFTGATAVRFGGVPADSIRVMSDTMIKAIVDTGATGSVSVFTPYGFASKPGFIYISDTTINDTLFVNAHTANAGGVIQKSFKLYPNPASKYVTWQQPITNHKTRIQLVDIGGRIVRQIEVGSNTPQTTIHLHGLIAGVYKLVYIDGKNKITSTLLIK